MSLVGGVFDGAGRSLGNVDRRGVVYRGQSRVALFRRGNVSALDGQEGGRPLGTVRAIVRPEYRVAYLSDPDGRDQAFILVDRRSCQIDEHQLLQLAGAALALLGPQLLFRGVRAVPHDPPPAR